MRIENKKVVAVQYNLTVKNEQHEEVLVEETERENPFTFLFGAGNVLEAFEENLKGKKVGDTFDFYIVSDEGYGKHDQEQVIDIPIDAFKSEDGTIDLEIVRVGNTLPMVDGSGNQVHGVVNSITSDHVRMDFNHPLAGQDLHFKGAVVEVRNASDEELAHGHVHGPGGHHH